jgi:hypothetical protein
MIGYGNSMFLATHGILARSASGGAVDPDAQAFITAASITNPTQQSAINQLVVDLKGYSIWTKMKALYPFVGGTSTTHKYNLKNPLDTNAAFRLVFTGGWTHSNNGILGNGINVSADTFLIPSTAQSINSKHFSVYSRTNIASGAEFGSLTGGTNYPADALFIRENGLGTNASFYAFNESFPNSIINTTTDSTGLFISTRTASNAKKLYRNGSTIGTSTSTSSAQPNASVKIGNFAGAYYTPKQYAFMSIGDGLTDTEAANLYTAVQAFQTTLGRQV